MTTMRGRCTNTDYCSKADTRQEIEVAAGEPFVCPECGKGLSGPGAAAAGGGRGPLLAGAAVVGVLVLGFAGYKMFSGSPAPEPAAPSPANTVAAPVQPAPPPPPAPAPESETTTLLRLRGDAAVSGSLAQALVKGFLTFSGDTDVSASAPESGIVTVSGNRGGRRESITIATSTAEDGFAGLANGGADVALSARPITAAEKAQLAALGDMGSAIAEHAVGVDALAVIVNPKSELTSISLDQLNAVIDGSIKDWSDLGISSADVKLLGQAAGSKAIQPAANGAAVAAQVAADPNAIAVVAMSDVGHARAVAVTGKAQAVAPNAANIASGDYPLARKLYFYTAPKSGNILVQRFAEYATSPSGQKLVAEAGFVAAGATTAEPGTAAAAAASGPVTAQTALAGLRRIDFEIHFNPNSTVPDVRAMRFIDSLYNILVSEHTTPSKMVLAGFADSQGTEEANLDISRKRAEAVAAILTARGMTPGRVQAFGSQNPIADNGTDDGREANRRVEIYLMP